MASSPLPKEKSILRVRGQYAREISENGRYAHDGGSYFFPGTKELPKRGLDPPEGSLDQLKRPEPAEEPLLLAVIPEFPNNGVPVGGISFAVVVVAGLSMPNPKAPVLFAPKPICVAGPKRLPVGCVPDPLAGTDDPKPPVFEPKALYSAASTVSPPEIGFMGASVVLMGVLGDVFCNGANILGEVALFRLIGMPVAAPDKTEG